jgi:uncharacterized protein (DUF924 family)
MNAGGSSMQPSDYSEMTAVPVEARRLLQFWFGRATHAPAEARENAERWFRQSDDFDNAIRAQFGDFPARAAAGKFDQWRDNPHSTLALVVTFDQLPRNLFRRTPQAFQFDPLAREVTAIAIAANVPILVHPIEAVFFYLPYEHAEDLAMQAQCAAGYEAIRGRVPRDWHGLLSEFVQAGREHREMIERFGRFPHRNQALGRKNTAEEEAYLQAGAKTYGQVVSGGLS